MDDTTARWRDSLLVVAMCMLWYAASALTSNTGKQIMTQFNYPVTLTLSHFFAVIVMIGAAALWRRLALQHAASNSASHLHAHGHVYHSTLLGRLAQRGHLLVTRCLVDCAPTVVLQPLIVYPAPPTKSEHADIVFEYAGDKAQTDYTAVLVYSEQPPAVPDVAVRQQWKWNRVVVRTASALALFQIGGHISGSMAMASAPVAFVHTIKALSPFFTVLIYSLFFGHRYSTQTYLSLVPLTLGVMLACSFEVSFDVRGMLFALCSTVVFVAQNIFSKHVLNRRPAPAQPQAADSDAWASAQDNANTTPRSVSLSALSAAADTASLTNTRTGRAGTTHLPPPSTRRGDSAFSEQSTYHKPISRAHSDSAWTQHRDQAGPVANHLDKVNILFYASLFAFVALLPAWLYSELSVFLFHQVERSTSVGHLLYLFAINGATHFLQGIIGISLLARVSTVTHSIASLIKRIVVIVASWVYFSSVAVTAANGATHQLTVSPGQVAGVSLTMLGLLLYSRSKEHRQPSHSQ
ncbi:hypothetical protein RI367_006284 [Sorochytrium milnesiophthora]